MPKAKSYKGVRMTRNTIRPSQQHRKEEGRPKGTFKKYPFEQTKLGFMLKHELPALYEVIMRMTPDVPYPEPKIHLIEIVCNASDDPSLKKPKFGRYLERYRKEGIYCKRPVLLTPQRAEFYEKLYQKKLAKYVHKNRSQVEKERIAIRREKFVNSQK